MAISVLDLAGMRLGESPAGAIARSVEPARQIGAGEVMVATDTYEQADRLESYRRVAEVAAGMKADPAGQGSTDAHERTVA